MGDSDDAIQAEEEDAQSVRGGRGSDDNSRSADPAPAGLNTADVPGVAAGAPGGAVLGSPGPGGGGGVPGDADLGGDGDLGGDENPLAPKTAGGADSGG